MIKPTTNTYNVSKMTVWKHALQNLTNQSSYAVNSNQETFNTQPIFALIMTINKKILNGDDRHMVGEEHENDTLVAIINQWFDECLNDGDDYYHWCCVDVESNAHHDIDNNMDDNIDNNGINNSVNNTIVPPVLALNLADLGMSSIDIDNDRLSDVITLRFIVCATDYGLIDGHDTYEADNTKKAQHKNHSEMMSDLYHNITSYLAKQSINNHILNTVIDCHVLPLHTVLSTPKMACFDMDSTLIEQEVIVEIAKATGIGKQVNDITESAMRGEINFNESFAQRVSLLRGTSADVLDSINESLTLSAGAMTTLAILQAIGCHTVLLSGGFTYFAQMVAGKLNIDEYHANVLLVDKGKVVGDVHVPIVDGQRKADLVQQIAREQGIPLSDVICVGDGANDLAMMAVSRLGIAYRAKPIVQEQADTAINCTGLEGVLYALGFPSITVTVHS